MISWLKRSFRSDIGCVSNLGAPHPNPMVWNLSFSIKMAIHCGIPHFWTNTAGVLWINNPATLPWCFKDPNGCCTLARWMFIHKFIWKIHGKFIGLGSIPYTNCHIPWKMKCPPSLDVFHGYLARRKPFLSGHWLHINNWTPNLDHLAPSGAQRAQRAQPENPGSWTPWSRIDHCCP